MPGQVLEGETHPSSYRGGALGSGVSTLGEGGGGEEAPPTTNLGSPGFRILMRFNSFFLPVSYYREEILKPPPSSSDSLSLAKAYYTRA